jgi:hypothetical protein
MSQRVRDINEIIAGIYDGLNGREPNEKIQALLDKYHDERAEAETSDWHGWECYCNRCCE